MNSPENQEGYITLAKMSGTYPEVTEDQAMMRFRDHMHSLAGQSDLTPEEALTLKLVDTYRWLPSEVRRLSDQDVRLLLHKDWQSFLATITDRVLRHAVEASVLQTPELHTNETTS
ncbi:MAG: hypothetical protein HYV60_14640 [Planctomycetia bacterium]|nr:hypothetical protein [Planctomycetia bacterium]